MVSTFCWHIFTNTKPACPLKNILRDYVLFPLALRNSFSVAKWDKNSIKANEDNRTIFPELFQKEKQKKKQRIKDSNAGLLKIILWSIFLSSSFLFFFLPPKQESNKIVFLSPCFRGKKKNLSHKFLQTNTSEFSIMIGQWCAVSFKAKKAMNRNKQFPKQFYLKSRSKNDVSPRTQSRIWTPS